MIKGEIKGGGGGSDLGRRGLGGEQGFIAIIALGIFLMLSIFGIIVQRTTMDTIYNIQTTNKYNEASDIANSVMEYLRYEMNMHEAGYNTAGACAYGEYYGGIPGLNDDRCDDIAVALGITDKNVEITMEIKGRGTPEDEFTDGTCPGLIGLGCYTIPLPGTGDAGDRCSMYTPTNDADALVDDNGQVSSSQGEIAQIDYSCNWNKLAFGSSSVDRVAIPLYYDDGTGIINPFHAGTIPSLQATEFSIRVRPPCLPCDSTNRTCTAGEDETVCDDSYRYELDDGTYGGDGENEIVVQWQLSGECGGEECGLIQYVVWDGDEVDEQQSSVISEQRINNNHPTLWDYISLRGSTYNFFSEGIDTSTYNSLFILDRLQKTQKPVLTLFLTEKLIDPDGNNVPYLEYQIITDKPIGSPKIKAEAIVNMDGYVFEKILYKEEQKSLIDFAVQN